jgi:hypothetical protein
MKFLSSISGLTSGFILGSLLFAQPLAAALGRTTVTWDAASCPAGNYTITATATHGSNGRTFEFRANTVLPRNEVSADFADLPNGRYFVQVEARRSDGLSFFSGQSVGVGSSATEPSVDSRRRTAGSREITGHARPRASATNTSTSPARPPWATRATPSASRASAAPAPPSVSVTVQQLLVRLNALHAAGYAWQRVDLIDADDDGEPDAVTVEFTDRAAVSWALPRRIDRD